MPGLSCASWLDHALQLDQAPLLEPDVHELPAVEGLRLGLRALLTDASRLDSACLGFRQLSADQRCRGAIVGREPARGGLADAIRDLALLGDPPLRLVQLAALYACGGAPVKRPEPRQAVAAGSLHEL